ncbi:MAG: secondary thiamine-phosphate synthase enzyme YjbQ [Methanobacteriota archaeon]
MAYEIRVKTKGEVEVVDLTAKVRERVRAAGVDEGLACVFVAGSTAAVTTLEFEPGLAEQDLPSALDRLFPRHGSDGVEYGHERAWHDGNGHSHVRAAFLGPSVTVPIVAGDLVLGEWQQIVLVELDNKPRERRVLVQVTGR